MPEFSDVCSLTPRRPGRLESAALLAVVLLCGTCGRARGEDAAPAKEPVPVVASRKGKNADKPMCAATTRAGNPCSRVAVPESTFCAQHARMNGETVNPRVVPVAKPVKGKPQKVEDCPVFVALDVETADSKGTAPCALALIRFEGGKPTRTLYSFIDPDGVGFDVFPMRIHKITPDKVAGKPTFAVLWREAASIFDGAEFISAHGAGFDRAVIAKACARYGLEPPALPFADSQRASESLGAGGKLGKVCEQLGIDFVAHQADSDANASGQIMVRSFVEGFDPTAFKLKKAYSPSKVRPKNARPASKLKPDPDNGEDEGGEDQAE